MNDSVTSKGTFRFFVCVRLYSLSQAKQEKWENSSKQINETNDTLNAMHRMTISRYSSIVFFPENRTKRYTLTRAGSFINFFSPSVFEPSFGHFHSRFILTALSVLFIYKRKCLHNRKKLLNKTKLQKICSIPRQWWCWLLAKIIRKRRRFKGNAEYIKTCSRYLILRMQMIYAKNV